MDSGTPSGPGNACEALRAVRPLGGTAVEIDDDVTKQAIILDGDLGHSLASVVTTADSDVEGADLICTLGPAFTPQIEDGGS